VGAREDNDVHTLSHKECRVFSWHVSKIQSSHSRLGLCRVRVSGWAPTMYEGASRVNIHGPASAVAPACLPLSAAVCAACSSAECGSPATSAAK